MSEFDPHDLKIREAVIKFTETGARAGCPFCRGRMIASVARGDRIVFLSGRHAGVQATVFSERGNREDEFLVNLDSDPPHQQMTVSYNRDFFARTPIDEIPSWLCNLSVDDLCEVDHAALRFALRLATAANVKLSPYVLLPLITVARQKRLPVLGADFWPTLEVHGLPKRLKRSFCAKFDFAIEVLVSMVGRPAIKKKRVPAMSIGRYLTPGQREFYGPSPGIAASTD